MHDLLNLHTVASLIIAIVYVIMAFK